jgi:cytochrome c
MNNPGTGKSIFAALIAGFLVIGLLPNHASSQETGMMKNMMGPGLMVPEMDPTRGKQLFASKGCVVCHSVNGIGGEDAPPLDASTMTLPMNPFEFAARMWRGAEAMVAMQREELGDPIELTGAELADIIAFVHDAGIQSQFSEKDIPERIEKLMGHMDEMGDGDHEESETEK